jgi:hypothetical protein
MNCSEIHQQNICETSEARQENFAPLNNSFMDNEKQKSSNEILISQYLPYFGSFIIFLGVIRLLFFYRTFGIPILNYLEFSEIITSFLDIIVIVVLIFVTSLIQNFIIKDKTEQKAISSIKQKIVNEDNFFKRIPLYIKYLQNLLIGGLILIVFSFIWHFFDKSTTYFTILLMFIFFVATSFFVIITVEIDRQHKIFNSSISTKRFISILINILLFVGLVIWFTYSEINTIRKDKSTYGTTIILDNDQVLISDSTNYFIGKTQQYLFIYHEKLNVTDVIPMTRVKQLTIKQVKKTKKRYNNGTI